MIEVVIRAYADLNDFLPRSFRQASFVRGIPEPTSVKDLLEGAGIPHSEIGAILVDGIPVTFDTLINAPCRVAAFPPFRNLVPGDLPALRPDLSHVPRFVVDTHLGRLARYLRLLGFDTLYENAASDERLVDLALQGDRVVLTRDRGLLMRKAVRWGYFVRHEDPRNQLSEVVRRFDLVDHIEPFQRCLVCNGMVGPVDKAAVEPELPPATRRHFDRFWQCGDCGRVYWQGTHYDRLTHLIAQALACV
jgi:uncharacterized protein